MKPTVILIPSLLSLVCAGGALIMARHRVSSQPDLGLDFSQPARHLVTRQMIEETEAMASKPAPREQVRDYEGHTVNLGSPGAERPQFVYFILDGCPCSVDAEPLFHALYRQFKGQIDFVAITDGDQEKAKRWSTEKQVPYPVVPDPQKTLIHAFGAKASTYSALVMRNGKILKMWPGFSAGILQEINGSMSRAVGEAPKPFDTLYAPVEKRTGCAF